VQFVDFVIYNVFQNVAEPLLRIVIVESTAGKEADTVPTKDTVPTIVGTVSAGAIWGGVKAINSLEWLNGSKGATLFGEANKPTGVTFCVNLKVKLKIVHDENSIENRLNI
jgi:hypothetical protein